MKVKEGKSNKTWFPFLPPSFSNSENIEKTISFVFQILFFNVILDPHVGNNTKQSDMTIP